MRKIDAILCDEVRREDNGKLIIIGVYTTDIVFRGFPASKSLSLWAHFTAPNVKKLELDFRIKAAISPSIPLFTSQGLVDVENPQNEVFITFPIPQINIPSPTTLLFELKEKGKSWKKILEIPAITKTS